MTEDVLGFPLFPPPPHSLYEDNERKQLPVADTGHKRRSVSRNSVKSAGNPRCIVSVLNTRSSEGSNTESSNRIDVRGFWCHDMEDRLYGGACWLHLESTPSSEDEGKKLHRNYFTQRTTSYPRRLASSSVPQI